MNTVFVLTHESDPRRTNKSMSLIALAITRSLGRKGVPVVRIHPNDLDRSLYSKYCSKVEVSPDFYVSEEKLLAFLLALQNRYQGTRLLIPASDDCAYFVSKYHDALSGTFEVLAPNGPIMEIILDKKNQYERAQSLGIPIPETYFPAGIEDVTHLAAKLANYPYVIKPLVSHNWRRALMKKVSQGRKGFAVQNVEELISQYETIAQCDKNVMIQEVIGGADERLFTFLSYFNAQSQPIAYCTRKKLRQLPVDFGYCTMAESCHDEIVKDQSIRLLQSFGFHGISGVEWKLDPRTQKYKLIEINPRAVNTIGIAPACGVDLAYIAFKDKIGGGTSHVTEWLDGIKWIDFEQDIWAAKELYLSGKLSLGEWWRSFAGRKVHAVYASDDLRPFVGYLVEFMKARIILLWKRQLYVTPLLRHFWANRRVSFGKAATQHSVANDNAGLKNN